MCDKKSIRPARSYEELRKAAKEAGDRKKKEREGKL
jgi:hypothetical protein